MKFSRQIKTWLWEQLIGFINDEVNILKESYSTMKCSIIQRRHHLKDRTDNQRGWMVALNPITKNRREKFIFHPTRIKPWISVPGSSERLSVLGILTHQSQSTHAEAQWWKAHTKHAHTRNHTKVDQSKTTERKHFKNLSIKVSAQAKHKLQKTGIKYS